MRYFYGGASPPKPPERGTPRREFLVLATTFRALFSATDDRLVNVIIMGASPHTPMRPFFMARFDFSKLK